ncbi:hypothetical protein D0T49_00255 [Paludibacter sp. 221]|uniref:hypothetical protein n=1 Tax=Paludibacter sp. 221 TaxID=2302939 RepID=UPI0013D1D541|nr:hypothetical protein [Paludibacter sp. 221]NDV45484.1 hypothetical protein [Paludibacter sp. 221]
MKTTNPHAWFFAHLKTIEGYGLGYDDVIKESIILEYSNHKTESLKELYEKYPQAYKRMRNDLSVKTKKHDGELDKARKRLIAAIFASLEGNGYTPDMDYVKRVACCAAKVKQFNNITLRSLKNLYNKFTHKNYKAFLDNLINKVNLN